MESDRLELQIKKSNIEKLKNTTILVIGLGGVGGYTVESLARSGIGHLILVDRDIVDITNINRQLIALHSTIGKDKVDIFKKRINDINPNIKVTIVKENILKDNIDMLFKEKIDYLVDACDTMETKECIISECYKHHIKLISSMGMGNKLDPTKLEIADISKTSYDPIAKKLRKYLKEEKINMKIPVVYSKEIPIKTNSNTISSNAFGPSIAGLLITSYIINDIIDMECLYE